MRSLLYLLFAFASLTNRILAEQFCPASQDSVSQQASSYLREFHFIVRQDAEPVSRALLLTAFYRRCNFSLAWTTNGTATAAARTIIDELHASASKGLNPQDYDSSRWRAGACALMKQCSQSAGELARFDLDLSIAFMRYILDLNAGRINPRLVHADLDSHRDVDAVARFMWSEIVPNQDVHAAIRKLEPTADGYTRVENALQRYRAAISTSPDVLMPPFRKSIVPGDVYDALPILIARLKQLDDVPADTAMGDKTTYYEGAVVDCFKHFQIRHGLKPSGIVDAESYRQLSIPLQQRALQLALTLERWRWIQHSFERAPVVVNIPEYQLRAYDDQLHVMLSMRVIVGGVNHRNTPVLKSDMTSVIFRPYWNVPASIARKEILPKVARDPAYLKRNGYEVVSTQSGKAGDTNTNLIGGIRSGSLRVRQIPGGRNALGGVKFVFPNPYNVYLHGTPQIALFEKSERSLSHGCIRVEDPAALAVWALRSEPGWSRDKVEESMAGTSTINVPLMTSIPVLIVYGTAIVQENEEVHFFRDIYGQDAALVRALDHVSDLRAIADREPW